MAPQRVQLGHCDKRSMWCAPGVANGNYMLTASPALSADMEQTELARSKDTVDLSGTLPKLLTGGMLLGIGWLMVKGLQQPRTSVWRRDAIDELADETRRIKQRVAARRASRR